jgi:predicted nucleic acid-binding protein
MGTEFMIYLDTHVFLWLFARKGEGLSVRALKLIESDPEITISPMVLLEIIKKTLSHARSSAAADSLETQRSQS